MVRIATLKSLSQSFREFKVGPIPIRCYHFQRSKKNHLYGVLADSGDRFRWFDPTINLRVDAWGSYAEGSCGGGDPANINFVIGDRQIHTKDLFTMFQTNKETEQLDSILGYYCFRFDPEKMDTRSPWGTCPQHIVRIPKYTLIDKNSETIQLLSFGTLADAGDAVTTESASTCSAWTPKMATWQPVEGRERFETRVATTEAACRAKTLEKVVIARCEVARYRGSTEKVRALTFEMLCQRFQNTMVFDIPMGEGGFIGATPETLIRIDHGRVETHALAGTVTARPNDMLKDAKLLREHACVTQDIRQRLDGICHQVDVDPTPSVREANGVYHLQTPIRGRLKEGGTLFDAIKQLHPTPALCGTPRIDSLRWLRQTESLDRGFYGGPVGLFDLRGETGIAAVAIRSAVLQANEAFSYAGAGIVSGSIPAAEWDETSAKLAAIQGSLNAVQRNHLADESEVASWR